MYSLVPHMVESMAEVVVLRVGVNIQDKSIRANTMLGTNSILETIKNSFTYYSKLSYIIIVYFPNSVFPQIILPRYNAI